MKNWIAKLLILSSIFLVGCRGPVGLLRHAEKDIKRAIEKGADLKQDSTTIKKQFEIKGAKTAINFNTILGSKPLQQDGMKVFMKDTIIYKDRIKTEFKDKVLYIECPDEEGEVEVTVPDGPPIIKAGYTTFEYIMGILGGFIFGFIIFYIISKFKPKNNVNVHIQRETAQNQDNG